MSLKSPAPWSTPALDGRLDTVEFLTEPAFGLHIPVSCPEVPAEILTRATPGPTRKPYDRQARDLAARFEANFQKFEASASIRAAGPIAL